MFDINLHLLLLTDEVDEILWYVVNAIDGIEGPWTHVWLSLSFKSPR